MTSQDDLIKAVEKWASIYLSQSLADFFVFLRQSEFSLLQAYALTYIFYHGPSKISELGDYMMVSTAATSQMVDRLEKQGLVNRTANPGDRRVRNVILSSTGEEFVRQSIEARQSWIKTLPAKLSPNQQQQISTALDLLNSSFYDAPE